MKSSTEKIRDIAQDMCGAEDSDICQNGCCSACSMWKYAERLYRENYCKAEDTVNELIESVARKLDRNRDSELYDKYDILRIIKEASVEKQQKVRITDQQLREKIAKHVCYACEMGLGDGDCAEGTDFRRCGICTEVADAIIADVINNIKESEDEPKEAEDE